MNYIKKDYLQEGVTGQQHKTLSQYTIENSRKGHKGL